jgi:hypothetical protein
MREPELPTTQVEYIPPSSKVIDRYSRKVCQTLAPKFGIHDQQQQTELVRGFTNFVKTIVQIHVKYLNKEVAHDAQPVSKPGTT